MNRFTAQGLCFLFLSFLTLTFSASGQQENTAARQNAPPTSDESFSLNISESRTSETNYERSTQIEFGGVQNGPAVEVHVGATVRAQNIVITLRGITGDVRFRASLEKIRRLIQ
jgi:hypothetical protein